MEKFKIKGIGIDTSGMSYSISKDHDEYDYVHTSLRASNEFVVKEYAGDVMGAKQLITSVTFLDKLDIALTGHLLLLERDYIDLLLVNTNCDFKKYKENLKDLLNNDVTRSIGLTCTGDLIELQNAINELKDVIKIQSVALDICPLNFNYEMISWLTENGYTIIGFNPFGGHLSSGQLIDAFNVPYLLSFAANYCDVVMLSSRDIYKSDEQCEYLSKLIDKETSSIYSLTKSSNKLIKPLKRIVKTSLSLQPDKVVLYNSPEALFDPSEISLKLGKVTEELDFGSVETDTIVVSKVKDYLRLVISPEDGDWLDNTSILRPKVLLLLKSIMPGYSILPTSVTDTTCIFLATKVVPHKKWYNRKKDEVYNRTFVLYNSTTRTTFFELENSPQSSSKP